MTLEGVAAARRLHANIGVSLPHWGPTDFGQLIEQLRVRSAPMLIRVAESGVVEHVQVGALAAAEVAELERLTLPR